MNTKTKSPAMKNSFSFIVRMARNSDLDDIMKIENICFGIEAFHRRQFRYALGASRAVFLVAETMGEKTIAGYALGYIRRGVKKSGKSAERTGAKNARLYSIAVSPTFQGMSLGAKLLSAIEAEFAAKKCARVFLEVHENNVAAATLYESRGYRQRGYKKSYYHDGGAAKKYVRSI